MQISWLKNWVAYIIVAIASVGAANWIHANVIETTILPNLTTTIIALLAINVATTASVSVKLKDIAEAHGVDFSNTAREFRFAISEQAGLIIISLIIVGLQSAKPIPCSLIFLQISTMTTFYASLHIFVDTSLGIVAILFPSSVRGD